MPSKKHPSSVSLSAGDSVKLIFTDEIGVVVAFIDGESVWVRLQDGDEIPVFLEHLEKNNSVLSVESPQLPPKNHAASNNKQQSLDKIKAMGLNAAPDDAPDGGISLIFQPFLDKQGDIEYFLMYLWNNTGRSLGFAYDMYLGIEKHFELHQHIGGREKIMLNTLLFKQLNDYPELEFKFDTHAEPIISLVKSYKPKAKMVLKPTVEVLGIPSSVFVVELIPKLPTPHAVSELPVVVPSPDIDEKIKKFAENWETPSRPTSIPNSVVINAEERIVDLHIEKLQKSYKHLTNSEILAIQLNYFEQQMQQAISRRERNMIVIHGLGKGKLKNEVINLLRAYPEVETFTNEYSHRFGFGATEIFFAYE